jgi:thiol-disulfide isomerase/thioredoxin
MKYNFFSILVLFSLISCETNKKDPNQFTLTIEVENSPRDQKLEIVRLNKDRARFTFAEFDGGKKKYTVEFEKRTEPEFIELHLFKKRLEILALTGEDFTVKVDMLKPDYFEVIGSPDTEMFKKFVRLDESFQKQTDELNKSFSQGKIDNSAAVVAYEDLRAKATTTFKELFSSNMSSSVAVMLFESPVFKKDKEWKFLLEMAQAVEKRFPGTELSNELNSAAQIIAQTGIGAQAPEINLKTKDGKSLTLSSLKGKFVLVDFWASWCKPCRMENPNLVKVYQKYKGKNFEILGTSLDQDRDKWLEAIAKDQLTWPQVIDDSLNTAGKTYNVQGIPHSVLIDPNGIILEKDIRGQALESKLEEIFKN